MQKPDFNVHLLLEASDVEAFFDYAESEKFEYMVLDVETDNVNEAVANLYGIGICFDINEAFYIPIRNKNEELWWLNDFEQKIYKRLFDLTKRSNLLGHNIIYDVLVLENHSPYDWTSQIYSDTILLKHTVDEEKPFGLKETAVKYLGEWADKAQQALYENIKKNGGHATKTNMQMYKADTEVLGEYCAWDTLLTRMLFDYLTPKVKEEGLEKLFYEEETMPLYKEVTIPMKKYGFPLDEKFLHNLNKEIDVDIEKLYNQFMQAIKEDVQPFTEELLNNLFPIKPSGNFPKKLAELVRLPLPGKEGKVSLAKKGLEALEGLDLNETQSLALDFILGKTVELPEQLVKDTQLSLYFDKNPDAKYVFNINSKDHLRHLLFDVWGLKPTGTTESGLAQVNDDFLDSISSDKPEVKLLQDYNKLVKLKSTYIEGFLERAVDGVLYTSMLQFGTTSGRFASRAPNLTNVPRPKEEDSGLSGVVLKYTNAIRQSLIAGKGNKIVDADYSALEPRAFASVSGEPGIQQVFAKGEDLYSRIAIDVFGVDDVSADPHAPNFLKKKHPEMRQKTKIFSLAVVYGSGPGRMANAMSVDYKEAEGIIGKYLDTYSQLKNYMNKCDIDVTRKGYVTTRFGRKRHLPEAMWMYKTYGANILNKDWAKKKGLSEEYWKLKNMLNLAKNHPIQGLAAHIVNRACIQIARRFKKEKINGYIALQVHDQVICIVEEHQAEQAKKIVQDCMENTTKIEVPLVAEPQIADNLRDSH